MSNRPDSFGDADLATREGLSFCWLLWRRRAGHVKNFLFDDCAVEIVSPITERNLRERKTRAHPVGSEVVDIIEINPTDGEIAQLFNRRGAFDVSEHGCLRLECERNKTAETAGFILELAQLPQMIDALFESLDMTVKHRAGAAAAHFVPGAMNIEPFLGRFFAAANPVPHFGIENFRAAASDGTETVFSQKPQCVGDRHLEDPLCEVANFNRGECF